MNPKTGVVYGIGYMDFLWKYDPKKKSWAMIGDTGRKWDRAGLAYHPGLHMLYASGYDPTKNVQDLYSIDPDTGEATLIGDSGIDLRGGLAFAPGVSP